MIKPKTITITRAEGPIGDCGKPRTVNTWLEANSMLYRWSQTAPRTGGYDKCDFKIVFEDGYEYDGRFDLVHHSIEYPRLDKHVRNFVKYLSGELPAWATSEKDIERVRRHQERLGAETQAQAKEFLAAYQLEAIA